MKLEYNNTKAFQDAVLQSLMLLERRLMRYNELKEAFDKEIKPVRTLNVHTLARTILSCTKESKTQRIERYGFMNLRSRVVVDRIKELDFDIAEQLVEPHELVKLSDDHFSLRLEWEEPDLSCYTVDNVAVVRPYRYEGFLRGESNRYTEIIGGTYVVLNVRNTPEYKKLVCLVDVSMIEKLRKILECKADVIHFEEKELNELVRSGLKL